MYQCHFIQLSFPRYFKTFKKNIYFKPANSLKFVCFLFSLAAISCVLYNTGLILARELSRKEFWEFTSKIACRRAIETSREKLHLF